MSGSSNRFNVVNGYIYIYIWNCGRKWWWLMVINGYINGD
jgi:hypothetical protein